MVLVYSNFLRVTIDKYQLLFIIYLDRHTPCGGRTDQRRLISLLTSDLFAQAQKAGDQLDELMASLGGNPYLLIDVALQAAWSDQSVTPAERPLRLPEIAPSLATMVASYDQWRRDGLAGAEFGVNNANLVALINRAAVQLIPHGVWRQNTLTITQVDSLLQIDRNLKTAVDLEDYAAMMAQFRVAA